MPYMRTSPKTRKSMRFEPLIRLRGDLNRSGSFHCLGEKSMNMILIKSGRYSPDHTGSIYHILAEQIDVIAVIHGATNVLQGEQE